jgi:hypothetical protein
MLVVLLVVLQLLLLLFELQGRAIPILGYATP